MYQVVSALAPEERAEHYRQLAWDAFRRAEAAENEGVKAGYLALSSGWLVLALEIEHAMRAKVPVNTEREDAQSTS